MPDPIVQDKGDTEGLVWSGNGPMSLETRWRVKMRDVGGWVWVCEDYRQTYPRSEAEGAAWEWEKVPIRARCGIVRVHYGLARPSASLRR